jgi:hypothetical protein
VHRGAAGADIPGRQAEAGAANPYFGLPAPDPGNARPAATPGDNASARTLLITAAHLATGVITLALTDFLDAYPDVTVQVAMMGGAISYVAEQIQMAAEDVRTADSARRDSIASTSTPARVVADRAAWPWPRRCLAPIASCSARTAVRPQP